jgi:hypothetical protein
MLGRTKLSTIRAELRKSLAMSDADLKTWFDRRLAELAHKPKVNNTEMETLELLRDALLHESKRGAAQMKR